MRHAQNHGACSSSFRRSTLGRCLPLLLTLSLTLTAIGCGGSYKRPPVVVDPVTVHAPAAKANLPKPEQVRAMGVDWTAVQTEDGLILGLTPEQFENLMTNLAEVLRWIHEAGWRLRYYGGEQ